MTSPTDRRSEVVAQSADIDALNHRRLAEAIIRHIDALPLGSVISIQGSWGRGKTDVLARAYVELQSRAIKVNHPEPLWLNPWQYGTPDLIRPVVLNLLSRMRPEQRGSSTLRRAVKTLLRAANAMAFKALTVVVPFGGILGAAEGPIDDLLKELFDSGEHTNSIDVDADPVAAMAERFRELVDEYLVAQADLTGRLIVCVDDLDRCLPDHQIAMLEAIHFLTGAGAKCSFLIALDPVLVQQAAITHYQTTGFDTNQYLDKLFDLRVNLSTLRSESIERIISVELSRKIPNGDQEVELISLLVKAYSIEQGQAAEIFSRLMGFLPELSNPRLVRRIVDRVRLLTSECIAREEERLHDQGMFRAIIIWCIIAERWPQLRQTLQAINPQYWIVDLILVAFWYGKESSALSESYRESLKQEILKNRNFLLRLPDKERYPDVGHFIFEVVLDSDFDEYKEATNDFVRKLATVDQVMVDFGL